MKNKLADYCDRRSKEENAVNSLKRMYWLQVFYYEKVWTAQILRCFWQDACQEEGYDGILRDISAGWGASYLVTESESSTEEEAISKLEKILDLWFCDRKAN